MFLTALATWSCLVSGGEISIGCTGLYSSSGGGAEDFTLWSYMGRGSRLSSGIVIGILISLFLAESYGVFEFLCFSGVFEFVKFLSSTHTDMKFSTGTSRIVTPSDVAGCAFSKFY